MRKKLYLCALIWQSAEINKSTLYINPTEDRGTGISTHPHPKSQNNLKTMKPTHIEHLGIAVTSLEEAMPFFEFLTGGKCYSIEEVADQKVKTAFFKVGEVKIELLEATSPESSIAKFIEKNGGKGGIHHVAFNVDSVEEALAEAEAAGIQLIDKAPRKGAENLMIAFLHPKSTKGILTELCEQPK